MPGQISAAEFSGQTYTRLLFNYWNLRRPSASHVLMPNLKAACVIAVFPLGTVLLYVVRLPYAAKCYISVFFPWMLLNGQSGRLNGLRRGDVLLKHRLGLGPFVYSGCQREGVGEGGGDVVVINMGERLKKSQASRQPKQTSGPRHDWTHTLQLIEHAKSHLFSLRLGKQWCESLFQQLAKILRAPEFCRRPTEEKLWY